MASDGAGKILVVDDTPRTCACSRPCSSRTGTTCLGGDVGGEALDLVATARPDLILLDVDAGDGRIRGVRDAASRRGERGASRDHGHVQHRPREGESDRGGGGRLHPKAVQQPRAPDPSPLAPADQALPRHDQGSGRAAGSQPDARGARPAPGEELERLRQLRRFLSPQLADSIVSSGDDSVLRSHRRQVAMLFATSAAGRASPTPSSPRS